MTKIDGTYHFEINRQLAEKQNVKPEDQIKIKILHQYRHAFSKVALPPDSQAEAEYIIKVCTEIEYQLQELWGFEKDLEFHRFWEFPHCSCPRYDNQERLGLNVGYIYSGNCLLHKYEIQKLMIGKP